jgi:hypothetical protein
MGRLVLIGDIGGHMDELADVLIAYAGADPHTLDIFDDTTVVQVGDLVHRGPDDLGVLRTVSRQIKRGRWVQLVGNHDLLELDFEQVFMWPSSGEDVAQEMQFLYDCGCLHAAASLSTVEGDVLVTHGGLTAGFYNMLKCPPSAEEAARRIDALLQDGSAPAMAQLQTAGAMLGRGGANILAGPIWAEAGSETRASWLNRPAPPFHQVHGHSSPFNWSRGEWSCRTAVRDASVLDYDNRHVLTTIDGQKIWGIDAGLGKYAGVKWGPLVLEGEVTYPKEN